MSKRRLDRIVMNLEKHDGEWVGQAKAEIDGEVCAVAEVFGDELGATETLDRLVEDVRDYVEELKP